MQTSSYPLVTIGMPVFNGERHVGDALYGGRFLVAYAKLLGRIVLFMLKRMV